MSQGPIVLRVHGLGHVPSFKNSKMIVTRPKVRLMTKPERQQWMRRCEDAFVSQLNYLYQTTEAVMPMVRSPRSWIACVAPSNDSVNVIREIHVTVKDVDKGEEGATMTIECYHKDVLGKPSSLGA